MKHILQGNDDEAQFLLILAAAFAIAAVIGGEHTDKSPAEVAFGRAHDFYTRAKLEFPEKPGKPGKPAK